jgi:hypothetical protein
MPEMPRRPVRASAMAPFDVREFARTAVGRHNLDLTHYDDRPLSHGVLRTLRYLRDLERGTMRYLRHVLVTPTHKDARVTAFLTTWAYEKYWIAAALDAVLDQHRYRAAATRRPRAAGLLGRASERFAPIGRSLVDNTLGEIVIAAHLAGGAADEWLIRTAYRLCERNADHPELTRTLTAITAVKDRHLAFFAPEARDRLRGSAAARRLTRRRMRYGRWPGSLREESPEDNAFFFREVIGADPEAVRDVDRNIRTLPGLGDLALLRAAVTARA